MTWPVSVRSASSIARPHRSRKVAVSLASKASWANAIVPTRAAVKSKEVAMPKFDPAPRTAQKRSGSSSGVARTTRPSASASFDRGEVVDGQAVRASEPAHPARGRQPTDPHAAVVAAADRQAVWRQRPGDVGPPRTGSDADRAGLDVEDLDRAERADVDDQPAVVEGPPGDAVTGAEDAERKLAVLPRERHCLLDLRHGPRPQGQAGCAAAQVAGPVAGVRRITGLDGALGQRGREVVVRDAGQSPRQRRRAADAGPLLRAAGAAGLRDPLAHLVEEAGEAAQPALVVAHHDEGADAVLDREPDQVVGRRLAADVEQPT